MSKVFVIPSMRKADFQQEVRAILGLFDGEINLYEKETERSLEKFLKIKKMTSQNIWTANCF